MAGSCLQQKISIFLVQTNHLRVWLSFSTVEGSVFLCSLVSNGYLGLGLDKGNSEAVLGQLRSVVRLSLASARPPNHCSQMQACGWPRGQVC